MLRLNLSTQPFYNVRAIQVTVGALTAIVLGLTLFNGIQIVRLTISQYTLGARAAEAEEEAARLRSEAVRIRGQIDPQELEVVAKAAREANAIIDQRAFSWTDLLTEFERTLPPDVRITAVQPRLEQQGDFVVAIGVQAKQAEDLDTFIEALEAGGGFHNVLSVQEQTGETGLIQAVVEGSYVPPAREATAPAREGTGQ